MQSAQNRNFDEDQPKIQKGKRSKSGTINLKRALRTRYANKSYVKSLLSSSPEVVVKVVGYTRGYRVKKVLDYIARTDNPKKDNVQCENDLGAAILGDQEINSTYDAWKKDFKKAKPGLKRKQRDAVHLMLSGDCSNTNGNAKKVLAAARTVVQKKIGEKGFDYISAIHRDSGRPHVHFVIKCKNRYKGQGKLRINQPELFNIRREFAKELTKLGLDHVATLRRDRPALLERVTNGIDRLQKNEKQFQRAMRRAAPSRDAFQYRKQVAQTITRLRDQIKKDTTPKTKERLDLLAQLRKVERQLTKNRPNIEKEIEATFNKYEKDFENFNKSISSREKADKPKQVESLLEKEKKAFQENVAAAWEGIKNADIPDQEKKDSLLVLDQYEKDMTRALRKGPLEYKNTAFEKDFKELNATAKNALNVKEIKPKTAVETVQRRRQLDRLSQELGKQIAATRKNIKRAPVPPEMKKNALAELRKFEKNISKQLNRPLVIARRIL